MKKLYDDKPYNGTGDFKYPLIVLGVLAVFAWIAFSVVSAIL